MIFLECKGKALFELQQKVKTKKYDCMNNHWVLKGMRNLNNTN